MTSSFHLEPMRTVFKRSGKDWRFHVHCGRPCVGYANASRKGPRLHLQDICVYDALEIPWPVLSYLGIPGRKRNYRGQGIGTELLMRVIHEAEKAGVKEIWGSVVDEDLEGFPGLVGWYERLGFEVLDPDEECQPGAVKKVVLRNPHQQT